MSCVTGNLKWSYWLLNRNFFLCLETIFKTGNGNRGMGESGNGGIWELRNQEVGESRNEGIGDQAIRELGESENRIAGIWIRMANL